MPEAAHSITIPLNQALPADAEEATLVAELQAGSEEAFAYLIAVYRNPVYNAVCHIMGGDAEAADVLQNTFIKIIRGIKQFRNSSSLKTWVYRIAVHEALNYRRSWFRHHRREAFSLDEEPEKAAQVAPSGHLPDNPYELVEQQERQEMVGKALRSLAEPYRSVVVLRELENLSYEEIGDVLGVADGTVKSRLKRGRELLRRKLIGCSSSWGF